ncbi:putative integral membrane protein [Brugia pahangi]
MVIGTRQHRWFVGWIVPDGLISLFGRFLPDAGLRGGRRCARKSENEKKPTFCIYLSAFIFYCLRLLCDYGHNGFPLR